MKFVLRVLCLPLVALCCIIKCIAMVTIKCGCYILSPALLFLGVCFVFTIIRQQWEQTFLLLILGSAGALFLIVATMIAVLAQSVALSLKKL